MFCVNICEKSICGSTVLSALGSASANGKCQKLGALGLSLIRRNNLSMLSIIFKWMAHFEIDFALNLGHYLTLIIAMNVILSLQSTSKLWSAIEYWI